MDMAPAVAHLMARELGYDDAWEDRQVSAFTDLAGSYLISGSVQKNKGRS